MPDKAIYRLCGGTFFTLLLQARKSKRSANDHKSGYKDDFDEKSMLAALIKIVDPSFDPGTGDTIKTYTSKYKSCTSSVENFFPLDNVSVENFSRRIKSHYSEVLSSMSSFVDKYIDTYKRSEWLVRALLEMVECDQTIPDTAEFIFGENNRQTNKQTLLNRDHFELQPFLLAIWSFIVMNRPDNKVGADTFNAWHQKDSKHSQKAFVSDIGMNWESKIVVDIIPFSTPTVTRTTSEKPAPAIKEQTLFSDSEQAQIDLHLKKSYEKYSKVKTFLYSDAPRYIYDFYVCNDVSRKKPVKGKYNPDFVIESPNVEILFNISNCILLSGMGGLGKSMMMRHLCLDAIRHFEKTGIMPLFVPLKNFNKTYENLTDYVFTIIQGLGAITDKRVLLKALSNGKCLLIFDGLDEIHSKFRYKFQHDLEIFTDTYSDNLFIMSCRPRNSFVEFNNFTVLYLCPLYFFQSIELINKLEFRPDEPSIKENFIEDINGLLSENQKEFIENPMLLTIMLITYDYSLSIPEKLHNFYDRAYNALSFRHDSNKSLRREFKTKLSPEHFSDYFAEFCARTYTDECYDFDEFTFDNYFHKLKPYLNDKKIVQASDFRDDLMDAMCLMIYEDCRYQFVHRSFQEYFCALCISKQMDEQIEDISFIFENSENRRDGDLTLDLLYCMIPQKVEKIIILPFLQRLFKKCDHNEGFITFLGEMFDIIEYSTPHKHGYTDYYSSSPLYNFIFELTHLEFFHEINELPHEDDFVYDKWVRLDESYVTKHNLLDNIMLKGNLPSDYIKKYGNPEIVGNYYVIEVSRLLANRSKYKRIIDSLSSNSCGIKKEYDLLKEYMHDLEKNMVTSRKLPPMMCLINSSIDSQQKKANRQRCRLAKRYDNIAKESHSNSCFIADNALQTIRFKYPNYYVTCGISARHNPNVRPYTVFYSTGRR